MITVIMCNHAKCCLIVTIWRPEAFLFLFILQSFTITDCDDDDTTLFVYW